MKKLFILLSIILLLISCGGSKENTGKEDMTNEAEMSKEQMDKEMTEEKEMDKDKMDKEKEMSKDKMDKEKEMSKETIVIGVSLPTQREERWVRDKKTMEARAKELGVDLKVQVSDADQAQQAQQVENLLSQNIDVLILAPHDAAASASLVEKAKEENIPVISYDRLVTGTDKLDYYISHDNYKVGELQGDFITKLVPKGKYIVLGGASTDNNAKLFYEGAMSKIQPLVDSGDIEILNGKDFLSRSIENWLPEKAQAMTENILSKNNNEVNAVLAPNDGTAGGVINALEAQGLSIPVTGQDSEVAAIKRIRDEKQAMTIFKDTNDVAKKAIEMAKEIAEGKDVADATNKVDNGKVEVPSVLLDPKVVTKDNFKGILIDSGYIKSLN